ncbi:MAG TPA: hypothetical protein VK281_09575 [Xanthobacteraceae bacterium]|nr:hypothetical protein [Xanthobacteraceae bacterium]
MNWLTKGFTRLAAADLDRPIDHDHDGRQAEACGHIGGAEPGVSPS